jgi:cold shock CspA family protein
MGFGFIQRSDTFTGRMNKNNLQSFCRQARHLFTKINHVTERGMKELAGRRITF